ncbi:flavin monoamine oxidase family protein [Paenarthrobacter sp. NyZ202]|uniref:flavin monoamine oxidase family protein n=1 Tax=Paenarthrobacter sp. NyZ202 TaxID=3402689 RepID=UPI003CF537AF
MSRTYDVAVIGGGFAGLSAAREASSLGKSVVLIEASDRLGGRTWTENRLGTRIELGGTDVHWLQPNVWSEIKRYGLDLEEFAPPEQLLYLDDGQVHEGSEDTVFGLMEKGMTALAELSRTLYQRPHEPRFSSAALDYDKLTLGEFLDDVPMSKLERDVTSSFWAAACQAPLHKAGITLPLRWLALSGWDWHVMLDVISRYKIVGGMSLLSDGILADTKAEFIMGTAVTRVSEDASQVTLTLSDESTISATAVVCAVPVNVLSRIAFEPRHPHAEKLAASGQISGGQKVVCRIKGNRTPYMAFAPEGHPFVLVQYDRPIDGDHIAVAFGSDATAVDGSSPAEVERVLRTWLPDIEVLEVATHNWKADELYRGTWAVPGPGQLREQLDAVEARDGRVLLAGADIASGSYALIDGAIATGIRAGRDAAAVS